MNFYLRRCLSKKVSEEVKMCLCKSLVLPILTYGVQFNHVSWFHLQKLKEFQLRVQKWITKHYKLNYEEILLRVDLLPLSMYLQFNCLFFFSSLLEQKFYSCPIPNPLDAGTRKNLFFNLKKVRTERARHAWVVLPNEPDCHYYRKGGGFLKSDWSKNSNYKAYEKSSKQLLRAKRVFLAAGMWLPLVRRPMVEVLIQQQGEIPS